MRRTPGPQGYRVVSSGQPSSVPTLSTVKAPVEPAPIKAPLRRRLKSAGVFSERQLCHAIGGAGVGKGCQDAIGDAEERALAPIPRSASEGRRSGSTGPAAHVHAPRSGTADLSAAIRPRLGLNWRPKKGWGGRAAAVLTNAQRKQVQRQSGPGHPLGQPRPSTRVWPTAQCAARRSSRRAGYGETGSDRWRSRGRPPGAAIVLATAGIVESGWVAGGGTRGRRGSGMKPQRRQDEDAPEA